LKIGDTVRLICIPPDLRDNKGMQTRKLFEKCLGQTFAVAAFKTVDGLPHELVQLDVGHLVGKAPYLETIWVEQNICDLKSSSRIRLVHSLSRSLTLAYATG
jgi:hypothetical protein